MSVLFKDKYTFEKRSGESIRVRNKYPNYFPVIVQRFGTGIPDIDKHKYLVPNNLTIGQFIYIIRNRIKLSSEKALFVFINNTIPPTGDLISTIYDKYKDEDGFLYMFISGENVFGINILY